ncbi:hypothetical protein F4561_002547 [Lipingzhangella halophila]|uniref:Uncharacterized protein n=1 Tax=Lipingzhangella halophila TaxID=1783352 RepID=A0A7W7RGU8_9ACTN|nr:hypothetical protein [Lipingzhangella halophila]
MTRRRKKTRPHSRQSYRRGTCFLALGTATCTVAMAGGASPSSSFASPN